VVSLTACSSGNQKFIDIPASLVVLFLSSTEVTEQFKVIGFNIVHSNSQISFGIKAGKNPIVLDAASRGCYLNDSAVEGSTQSTETEVG
jgi:hypothetical protein